MEKALKSVFFSLILLFPQSCKLKNSGDLHPDSQSQIAIQARPFNSLELADRTVSTLNKFHSSCTDGQFQKPLEIFAKLGQDSIQAALQQLQDDPLILSLVQKEQQTRQTLASIDTDGEETGLFLTKKKGKAFNQRSPNGRGAILLQAGMMNQLAYFTPDLVGAGINQDDPIVMFKENDIWTHIDKSKHLIDGNGLDKDGKAVVPNVAREKSIFNFAKKEISLIKLIQNINGWGTLTPLHNGEFSYSISYFDANKNPIHLGYDQKGIPTNRITMIFTTGAKAHVKTIYPVEADNLAKTVKVKDWSNVSSFIDIFSIPVAPPVGRPQDQGVKVADEPSSPLSVHIEDDDGFHTPRARAVDEIEPWLKGDAVVVKDAEVRGSYSPSRGGRGSPPKSPSSSELLVRDLPPRTPSGAAAAARAEPPKARKPLFPPSKPLNPNAKEFVPLQDITNIPPLQKNPRELLLIDTPAPESPTTTANVDAPEISETQADQVVEFAMLRKQADTIALLLDALKRINAQQSSPNCKNLDPGTSQDIEFQIQNLLQQGTTAPLAK